MIKAIIFDWGGVILKNPLLKMLYCFSKNIKGSNIKLKKSIMKFLPAFEKGLINEKELWIKVEKDLKIKINEKNLWKDCFAKSYILNKKVFSLAKHLKKKGYKIGLLSNTSLPTVTYFKKQKYKVFDRTVFSCLEGHNKPEISIYKIVLKRLRVKASEAIFIDDNIENVKAAKKLGMYGILYKNYNKFEKELLNCLKESFYEKIYEKLKKVPKGKVTTYKELANSVGSKAYRAVGTCMNKNPYAPKVPCHRVVNSDGKVGGFASGTKNKIRMLKKEGVKVEKGKIDLNKYLFRFH